MRITYRTRWHRRAAMAALIGTVFLTGLTIGNRSQHAEDTKGCQRVAYSQARYREDVARYGQQVADYNEGFAVASDQCPR